VQFERRAAPGRISVVQARLMSRSWGRAVGRVRSGSSAALLWTRSVAAVVESMLVAVFDSDSRLLWCDRNLNQARRPTALKAAAPIAGVIVHSHV
jgi:hypothetical protein